MRTANSPEIWFAHHSPAAFLFTPVRQPHDP
jgi:hypothetical protein